MRRNITFVDIDCTYLIKAEERRDKYIKIAITNSRNAISIEYISYLQKFVDIFYDPITYLSKEGVSVNK